MLSKNEIREISEEDETETLQGEVLQRLNIENYYFSRKSQKMLTGMMIFLALFSGFVFFLTTGSILMIYQLQQAKRNKKDYQLFYLLGMKEEEMIKNIKRTIALTFALPIFLGLVISLILIRFLSLIFPTTAYVGSFVLIVLALLGVYSLFYYETVYHYLRWLKR